MKKTRFLLLAVVVSCVLSTTYLLSVRSQYARESIIASMVFAFAAPVAAFYYEYERKSTPRMIALISCIAASNVVLRQMFHGFGPTPVFFLVIMTGLVFGPLPGFIVGSSTILASNFFVGGHGPWTVLQMTGLGLTGFFAAYLPKWERHRRAILCLYGAASGVLYGLFTDLFSWLYFSGEYTLATYAAVALRGAFFTASYSIGNVFFLWFLSLPMLRIFSRFKRRLAFSKEDK